MYGFVEVILAFTLFSVATSQNDADLIVISKVATQSALVYDCSVNVIIPKRTLQWEQRGGKCTSTDEHVFQYDVFENDTVTKRRLIILGCSESTFACVLTHSTLGESEKIVNITGTASESVGSCGGSSIFSVSLILWVVLVIVLLISLLIAVLVKRREKLKHTFTQQTIESVAYRVSQPSPTPVLPDGSEYCAALDDVRTVPEKSSTVYCLAQPNPRRIFDQTLPRIPENFPTNPSRNNKPRPISLALTNGYSIAGIPNTRVTMRQTGPRHGRVLTTQSAYYATPDRYSVYCAAEDVAPRPRYQSTASDSDYSEMSPRTPKPRKVSTKFAFTQRFETYGQKETGLKETNLTHQESRGHLYSTVNKEHKRKKPEITSSCVGVIDTQQNKS
uniref:Uncharacterized LOC100181058 n=1 Tax=Ciona intestinalis TaxID=7719 RepID=F6VGJ5_CIOIN|nr:uncharacterized protein LOC100181058 [Ciona intestinalis]|eukprot:XP_002131530.1 uncharacterized protein LOC100181058 [Ciona intestinalis]